MASYSDDSVILNLTFINKRSSSISVGLVQAWNYKTHKWNSVGIENKIIGMINVKRIILIIMALPLHLTNSLVLKFLLVLKGLK